MLNRFEEFTFLINRINKGIQKIKSKELKKYGLNGSQMDFIYYLGKSNGLTFKQLCSTLDFDKSFVSRNIKILKNDNLVIEDKNDNKTIYILTKKGKDIYIENKKKTEEICEQVYLSDNKIDEFYKNLSNISKKIDLLGGK